MKWYQYIFARRFMKLMDQAEKWREKAEIYKIQDAEVKFDKGYWHFDEKRDDYIFIEPKENVHFVTLEVDDDQETCLFIISKKPLTIDSEKFNYSWDAEGFCFNSVSFYRDMGYKIKVKRKAPIVIADSDLCCPYCVNASTFRDWAVNSYKQELLLPLEKLATVRDRTILEENITVSDIETEKLWCPICNNGIEDRKWLITKGNEWKVSIINEHNLPQYISPYMNNIYQKQNVDEANVMFSSANEKRNRIIDPFNIITDNTFEGLVVKGTEKIMTKNGLVLKPKWVKVKSRIPSNFDLNADILTSYFVNTKINWIQKRDKNSYPILYIPLSELNFTFKMVNNKLLQQATKQFHAGEPLDPIRITPNKEIIGDYYLVQLAFEIGFSHVPVIVNAVEEQNKALVEEYKDKIKVEQHEKKTSDHQMEGNTVKAVGTFIKKGNRVFRTKAYIQWGHTNNIIGSVIMLNPGSASLLQVDSLIENTPIQVEIVIDPTMESIIKLVEDFYENNTLIEGRLYIYNLFPLQNARSNEAIKVFKQLWSENEPLVKSLPEQREMLLNNLENSPWILLGWGCGRHSEHLNFVKKEWLDLIKQSKILVIGKMGKTDLDFYHPRPHLKSQQIEYRKELKVQYNQLLKEQSELNTEM